MKVPNGLLDPQGRVAKGMVYLELNGNEVDQVQEFGLTVTGKHSTCFALVSPGDVLTANFALNSGITGEFADLVVDGVLRNSWPNTRGQKVFTYIFDRAIYAGNLIGENKPRKATKATRMKVIERTTQKDLPVDGKRTPSAVGSIKIQIYRKETTADAAPDNPTTTTSDNGATQYGSGSGSGNGDANGGDATAEGTGINLTASDIGVVQRDPNFVQYTTWQDLNRRIDSKSVPPPFEIGFFDGNKQCSKQHKERVLKEYPGDFKLWASFTFLLRSTADLRALGFDDVPLHYSPSPPSSSTFATTAGPSQASCTESSVAQANDSVDSLFVVDDGDNNDESGVEPMDNTKKDAAIKKSKKIDTEQPTTSTILDQLAKNGKKGKLGEPTKSSSNTAGKESKLCKTGESETREQYIARKKAELVLPGVRSAPAQQAWLQRGATEEPEEDDDHPESTPATPQRSGMADILSSSMQTAPQTPVSYSQGLPTHIPRARRRSSPPALGFMRTPSAPPAQGTLNYSMPDFPNTRLPARQGLPAHVRHERSPSLPVMASSALANSQNREVLTYQMPGVSSALRVPIAQMMPICAPGDRVASLQPGQLESRPSTPINREVDVYSMPAFSSFPTSSTQQDRRPSVATMASESAPSTPPNREGMNYSVPSFTTTPRPRVPRFSTNTTPDRRQSNLLAVQSLQGAVLGPQGHHYEPVSVHTPEEGFTWNLPLASRMSGGALEAVMSTGGQTGSFDYEVSSGMMKTESRRTTGPSTLEPSEIQTKLQPQPEDSEMTGILRPSSPLPSAHLRDIHTESQPRDSHMIGTIISSSPVAPKIQIEATHQLRPQILRSSRSSSPALSVALTEAATEVASPSALETSRKNSQKYATSSKDLSLSPTTFSPQHHRQRASFHTPQASFNHTFESPVLGSSQVFLIAPNASPLTPAAKQARIHWQSRTPLNEMSPKVAEVQRGEDQNGNFGYDPTLILCMEAKLSSIMRPEPAVQPTQSHLLSPPASAQKRKADSITGGDSFTIIKPDKIPSLDRCLVERKCDHFEPQRAALLAEKVRVEQQVKELRARNEESRRRIEEGIKQQNEVARARMAAAEHQRKELQTRYEAAIAVQKEREKVNELNQEAERLERENAELQAKIAALYRGESI